VQESAPPERWSEKHVQPVAAVTTIGSRRRALPFIAKEMTVTRDLSDALEATECDAMDSYNIAVVALLAATSALPACSTSDTIVALNVTATDAVGEVEHLSVTITQEGQDSFTEQFSPPSEVTDDGGMNIKNAFYERIELPSGWDERNATVAVTALDRDGTEVAADETVVEIQPQGAVAAYVLLGEEP